MSVTHSSSNARPHPELFVLQKMVVDMALIDRNHHLINHERAENDIEHSFTVAILCWYIHDRNKLPLDLNKILKYALVHDFTELYTGDVNTYASDQDRQRKAEMEKVAVKKLSRELSGFKDMANTIQGYDQMADDEALFVWTVDKMQAFILGDLDGWRPYKKVGITYDRFVAKHSEQLGKSSAYCKEIFQDVLEYCKTTYYDRPQTETKT